MMMMIFMFSFLMISLILITINIMISMKKINNREKSSPFECGFEPMSSARLPFSMHFYLVSIIFLIFDVEIIIFIPMITTFLLNKYKYWMNTSLMFVLILLMGLYMEWYYGSMEWMK